jgi:S1-C subfamily serine protease
LIAHGKVIRPQLGIDMDERISEIVTRRLGIEGVLILGVVRGGGAEAAGLRGSEQRRGSIIPGDIIQEIDGKKVRSVNELLSRLGNYDAGDTVTLTVSFEGRTRKVPVKLSAATR